LRDLAESFARAQQALLARDRTSLERETWRQAQLAGDLRVVTDQVNSAAGRDAGAGLPQQLRIYAALLRRARRTVDVLIRAFACRDATYGAALQTHGAVCNRRPED